MKGIIVFAAFSAHTVELREKKEVFKLLTGKFVNLLGLLMIVSQPLQKEDLKEEKNFPSSRIFSLPSSISLGV